MSARPPSAPAAPAALAAFLRGVERRGAVLAELQCGDADRGDAALAAALAAFRAEAADLPMSRWPTAFWARLLAEPRLHARTPVALPLDPTDELAALGHGPRAALLLRLAAGLSEAEAADALGVAVPSYRLALQRALPQGADGAPDAAAWARLRDAVQRRLQALPPARLQRLAQARDAALQGRAAAASAAPALDAPRPRPHRALLALLWLLLLLCAAALAASFLWPQALSLAGGDAGGPRRVQVEPLPPAEPPAARFDADHARLAHPDFALLADADGERDARELAFFSWLAAQDPARVAGVATADAAGAGTAAEAARLSAPDPAAQLETADAPR